MCCILNISYSTCLSYAIVGASVNVIALTTIVISTRIGEV